MCCYVNIFLGFFIFETLLRMWALGFRIYFESSFNKYVFEQSKWKNACCLFYSPVVKPKGTKEIMTEKLLQRKMF